MRSGVWMKRRIPILFMMLTLSFLTSCQTIEGIAEPEAVHPPLPEPADIKPVHFEDVPELGGLLLSYNDYRALRYNIIEYRREIADLRDTLEFYREEGEQ